MKIVYKLDNYPKQARPLHIALGNFDGVHRGHQKIIKAAVVKARNNGGLSAALIFDPHPLSVLKPEFAPRIITDIKEKAAILRMLGLDILILIEFNEQISLWSPRQFVEKVLVEGVAAEEVYIGFNYSFGHCAQGTADTLQALGKEYGFGVNITPQVKIDGKVVSSTRIRRALENNDLKTANRLLGHVCTVRT